MANFGKMLYIAAGASIGGSVAGRFAMWALHTGTSSEFISNNFAVVGQLNTALQGKPLVSVEILALTLLVACAAGALLGLGTALVVQRLRADYFAMALFSAAQVYNIILNNFRPIIGGPLGISIPNPYLWAGQYSEVVAGAVIVAFGVAIYFLAERLIRTPLGRTLRAIREDPVGAEAYGKDVARYRLEVLVVASAISAVAGALYSFYTLDVYSQTFQYTTWTIYPWLMTVLGGAGNNPGVALGVFLYLLVVKATDTAQFAFQSFLPFSVTWLQYFLISGMLFVTLYLRPQGLIPEKTTLTISRKKLRELMRKALGEVSA